MKSYSTSGLKWSVDSIGFNVSSLFRVPFKCCITGVKSEFMTSFQLKYESSCLAACKSEILVLPIRTRQCHNTSMLLAQLNTHLAGCRSPPMHSVAGVLTVGRSSLWRVVMMWSIRSFCVGAPPIVSESQLLRTSRVVVALHPWESSGDLKLAVA